ncbi:MAG: hypothetical protein ACOC2W_03130 [bacterium]
MNKESVENIVKSEIRKFVKDELDKEISDNIKKNNTKTRDELIKIIKNSIEAVYKVLWQKRDFWKSDIK